MKKNGLSAYALKMIAIVGMVIQHGAMVFRDIIPLSAQIPLHIAGGLTFPLLAYFVSEGYKYTSNFKKYIARLLVFALLAQVPFAFALGTPALVQYNILFTIALGLLAVRCLEGARQKPVLWLWFLPLLAISLFVQFSFMGILIIVLFRIIKKERWRRFWPIFLSFLFFSDAFTIAIEMAGGQFEGFGLSFFYRIAMGIGNLVAMMLLFCYQGQRGPKMKYFFYWIYPLHFVVIIALAYWLSIPLFFIAY